MQLRSRDSRLQELESQLLTETGDLEQVRRELSICHKQEERAEAEAAEMQAQMADWRLQVEQRQKQSRQLQKELQRMRTENAKTEAAHQRALDEPVRQETGATTTELG